MPFNLSFFQIIVTLIASTFLLNSTTKLVRKIKGFSFIKFFATVLIWGTLLFFSLFPSTAHTLSTRLGLGENLNTIIFLGFVLVFIILFRLLAIIEKIECSISDIVRNEALKKMFDR